MLYNYLILMKNFFSVAGKHDLDKYTSSNENRKASVVIHAQRNDRLP